MTTDDPTTDDPTTFAPRDSALLAPAPTAKTIKRRTSLPFQLFRFAAINIRMAKIIRRSHQH